MASCLTDQYLLFGSIHKPMHTGPGFSELEAFTMADDDQQMREFDADFAFLVESGFVAVKQLDETSATRIFHAARQRRGKPAGESGASGARSKPTEERWTDLRPKACLSG
jgi:hypothetical protein